MAEIVNLRQVKKRRARAVAEAKAAANRASHGRSKTEVQSEEQLAALRERTLDQAKIDDPEMP